MGVPGSTAGRADQQRDASCGPDSKFRARPGSAGAPVTLTEFADPQCPVCKEAASADLPTLVNDYVRTGKVKLRAELLQFIGPDSVTAARYAAGAAAQGRLWPFLATFYAAQLEENSGYVTPAFLRSVAKAAGVDPAKASAYASTPAAADALNSANRLAQQLGVNSTPTFVAQRGNGAVRVLGSGLIDPAQLHSVMSKALAK
jgi:protein-disulfide isomerase